MNHSVRNTIIGVLIAVTALLTAVYLRNRQRSARQNPSAHSERNQPTPSSERRGSRLLDDDVRDYGEVAQADPDGTLRLEGQVIDDEQRAVSKAVVVLGTSPPTRVVAEDDGTFVFTKLSASHYRLAALKDADCAGPIDVRVNGHNEPVILTLKRGGVIDVSVTSRSDGRPVAGATVEARAEHSAIVIGGSTGPDGSVHLVGAPPGRYTVMGRTARSAADYQVVQSSGGETTRVQLTLDSGFSVRGRVLADGHPVAHARVSFDRASEGPWSHADVERDSVSTDDNGIFQFESLVPGAYRFIARHPDFAAGATAVVPLRSDKSDVEIAMQAGAVIAGRVVRADGSLVADAVVHAVPDGVGAAARPQSVRTDASGGFQLHGLPRQSLRVFATSDSATSSLTAIDLRAQAEQRNLTITLDLAGTISGFVVDSAGHAVDGANVVAVHDYNSHEDTADRVRGLTTSTATDAAGRFVMSGIDNGSYALRAEWPDRGADRALTEPSTATARSGDQNVRLVLRRPGTVSGRVQYADGTSPALFKVRAGMSANSTFVGNDGAFTLRDVKPGTRELTISGSDFEGTSVSGVSVSEDRDTQVGAITVKKGRVLYGRVVGPDGAPVPGASIYAGKRVIGSGSNLTLQTWTGSASGATRTDSADDQGRFALRGVGTMDLVLLAEHPAVGRSKPVTVPGSDQSSTIDLILETSGAIQGRVTRGGQPLAGKNVTAQPISFAHLETLVVTSGADGTFRFDRVTPDKYQVTALNGTMPIAGVTQTGVAVEVSAGQVANADIDLPSQVATLLVSPLGADGAVTMLAEVHVVSGAVQASVARQVHDYESQLAGGFYSFNIIWNGQPARVRDVAPGKYTACAVPYPSSLTHSSQADISKFVDTQGKLLPAYCRPIQVTDEPEQRFAIPVRAPAVN